MKRALSRLATCLALTVAFAVWSGNALAAGGIVISQVYGAGGNSGAVLQNDYVELFNPSASDVSLSGLSVQYASATGTGQLGAGATGITPLSGTLPAGRYLLVREAGGTTGGPVGTDIDDSTPIAMAAGAGKVALVASTTSLGCNGGSTPCSPAQLAQIIDLVGYGTGTSGANFFEGSGPAPTISATLADFRAGEGCTDTDSNAADFSTAGPAPRSLATTAHPCGVVTDAAPSVSSTSPANGATGVDADANVTITFSEGVSTAGDWFSIACTASGTHAATSSAGLNSFTLDPAVDFSAGESCTVTINASGVTDIDSLDPPDNMAADYSFSFSVASGPAPITHIHTIQGASQVSPLSGQSVTNVRGIVTGRLGSGFYMQDPDPDADPATSEGVFVFTSSAPTVAVGDLVRVDAQVNEFIPGGASSGNLPTTELSGGPHVTVLSSGNPLPAPIVAGTGGRVPPNAVVEDDSAADVRNGNTFDPDQDGLDFWESLEAMRVQINDPVAVGPQNSFGELAVVGDNGANATPRTVRGGVMLTATDGNGERITLDDQIVPTPPVANVGDHFDGPAIGVVDYNFGLFMLELTQPINRIDSGLVREMTTAAGANELSIATFNVENLDVGDGDAKFNGLADRIVNNLRSPKIVALEEVQDNNGPTDNGVVESNVTLDKLVAAIGAAGGPSYTYTYIAPVNDEDGGEPGGNIRIAFLYDTAAGVSLPAGATKGGSTDANSVVVGSDGKPHLALDPGRIDPVEPNGAWDASRKPLAGEFLFQGRTYFVIGNHFNSKGGDDPLTGRFQPPVQGSTVQRHKQAVIVHDFVASILDKDPQAKIVVLGDLNDFQFSDTVHILEGGSAPVLFDMIDTLPENEQYSYEFEGNAQVLDHILVSSAIAQPVAGRNFDVVHINSEFSDQLSDHDPSVLRIKSNGAPVASAGGPYEVAEGSTVVLHATATDPDGDALTYTWDFNGDGVADATGANPTFDAAALDGPTDLTAALSVSDGQVTTHDTAAIHVTNVAPAATFNAPAHASVGSTFTLSLTAPSDPSHADATAGFSYAFDCGSGFSGFGLSSTASCTASAPGTVTVGGRIRDKDNGVTTYTAQVQVDGITAQGLCQLTLQYVQASPAYRSLPPVLRKVIDALAKAACDRLAVTQPVTPARKAAAIAAYRSAVTALAAAGWLTPAQAATLRSLAGTL